MNDSERIEIEGARGLLDEPVGIRLSGFAPGQEVTLRATMSDLNGVEWQSEAAFLTDENGCVDVTTQKPLRGTYNQVDGIGLFWSMMPASPTDGSLLMTGFEPIAVKISTETLGEAAASATIVRLPIADGVTAADVRESGIVGRLFSPPGAGPHPGVVMLGGSGGGLPGTHAAFIASHGFATLALAYFAYDGLPAALKEFPLEYFGTAITWLQKQDSVKANSIGLVGGSRGGELVLLLGATYPNVHAVVSIVPSHVVWPGIGGGPDAVSWTHRGQPVPMMPASQSRSASGARLSPEQQTGPIDLTPRFLAWLENEAAEATATIAVEQINGPVLLVSGSDDAMWPSTLMASRVMETVRA